MNHRKIENKEAVIYDIQKALSSGEDAKYIHRLDLVLLAVNGMSAKQISQLYGEPIKTIQTWTKKACEQGIQALRTSPKPGRTPRLTQAQMSSLEHDLQHSPLEFGYECNLWDGILLSKHILEKYDALLQVRQCQRILHKLGFTLQRPQTNPSGANPVLQDEFKKTESISKARL